MSLAHGLRHRLRELVTSVCRRRRARRGTARPLRARADAADRSRPWRRTPPSARRGSAPGGSTWRGKRSPASAPATFSPTSRAICVQRCARSGARPALPPPSWSRSRSGSAGRPRSSASSTACFFARCAFDHAGELHLVRVWWNDFSASLVSGRLLRAARYAREAADLVGAYFFPDSGFALAGRDGPELVEGGFVTPDLLEVLRVAPRLGRRLHRAAEDLRDPDQRRPLAQASGRHARRHRPQPDPGRPELRRSSASCPPASTSRANEMATSGRRRQLKPPTRRGPFFLTLLARVPAGSSLETAEARITTAVTPVLRDRYGIRDSWRYGLKPLHDALVGDVRETLLLTFAAVSLVLIIAMANVANLLLARGTVRTRELAVRAVARRRARPTGTTAAHRVGGARRCRRSRLACSSRGLLVDIARTAGAEIVPRMSEVRVDAAIVAFGCALGLCSGLLAGVLPVMRLPWRRLGDWLREGGRTGESVQARANAACAGGRRDRVDADGCDERRAPGEEPCCGRERGSRLPVRMACCRSGCRFPISPMTTKPSWRHSSRT